MLETQRNGMCLGVAGKIIEDLAKFDVARAPGGDDAGKADVPCASPVESGRAKRFRLRNDGKMTGPDRNARKCGMKSDRWPEDAGAGRAEDANSMAMRNL